jgi:hypothetical protein
VPETTQYFEAVTARRAIDTYNFEQSMEGNTTVSAETQDDLVDSDFFTYVLDNLASFIRHLRHLTREDQDILLAYYLLNKSQTTLAITTRTTQTIMSFRLRMATKKMAAAILFNGWPDAETMSPILERAGLEKGVEHISLSKLIDAYARCRSFQKVAEIFHLHRPDIRRAMSRASKQLLQSKEPIQKALGAYVFGLVDKSSATGVGKSKRQRMKQGNMMLTDPAILGQFVVNVADPDFDAVLTSHAWQ